MTTHEQGFIKNLRMEHSVWYQSDKIAVLISLSLIKNQFRVAYASKNDGVFEVHIGGKFSIFFLCYSNALHLHECGTKVFSFVESIAENKEGYSKRQIHNAEIVGIREGFKNSS